MASWRARIILRTGGTTLRQANQTISRKPTSEAMYSAIAIRRPPPFVRARGSPSTLAHRDVVADDATGEGRRQFPDVRLELTHGLFALRREVFRGPAGDLRRL